MKQIKNNLLACLLLVPLAQGVAHAAESADGKPPVDQVVVEGTRADLVKAAKDVLAAEQRFYDRYNDFNTSRKHAVRCTEEADTGSRFKKKTCKPVYEDDATSSEGRDFALALGRGSSAGATSGGASASGGVMASGMTQTGMGTSGLTTGSTGGDGSGAAIAGGGTDAAFIAIAAGRPEFQKNVLEVARKRPELMKLLEEHGAAVKRYQELYQKLNGEPPAAAPTGTTAPTR